MAGVEQGPDCPASSAHAVVFLRMAEVEQEEPQSVFGPFAARAGAQRGHQRQCVDLEAASAQVFEGLLEGKEGRDIVSGRQPPGPRAGARSASRPTTSR